MPRTRESVKESVAQIKSLEEQYAGTPMEGRLRMLRLLKERPKRTLKETSALMQCSERSVQRWWEIYRRAGLQGMLEYRQPGGRRPRRIDDAALSALQQKLEEGAISRLSDAQEWLEKEFDVRYSRSGVWYLIRNALQATPGNWGIYHDDDMFTPAKPRPAVMGTRGVPEHILRFLNRMPMVADSKEAMSGFRDALSDLLDDVDRISVVVNYQCNLTDPESYRADTLRTRVIQVVDSEEIAVYWGEGSHAAILLESLRKQGLPLDLYHPPHAMELYYHDVAYLGVVFLWREVGKPLISPETLAIVEQLRRFITFILSDVVARERLDHPIGSQFHAAMAKMKGDAKLSAQEGRVVTLQLLGHSYKEIAAQLYVSIETVKKHFKQIYRKTRTKGQADLFAKYFTTRFVATDSQAEEEEEDD